MRVLHLDDRFTLQGGVGQYIVSLADLLAQHGHQNAVAYLDPSTPPTDLVESHLLPDEPRAQLEALWALIADERPDVAMVHQVSSPKLVRAVVDRIPTVAYVHGFPIVCPGLAKLFQRGDRICTQAAGWRCFSTNYLRRCSSARNPATMVRLIKSSSQLRAAYASLDHILVGSGYMRDLLIQNGLDASRISVLAPHFVSFGDIPDYEAPADPQAVLFAGRLELEKGLPFLFQAVQLLPPSIRLVVAGEGTQRAKCEELAEALGVGERVEFTGWLGESEMAALYKRCSAVVMCSTWPEPYGKVGVEAMFHGRPVVAFQVGGIPDWLIDGWNGRLVAPLDVRGLAEAISDIVADPEAGMQMGRNGQRWVTESLSAKGHLERMVGVFEHAIEARSYA